ncbi:unnamed protein product [Mytilus edulis]|uniref:C-type lectin domain-containing protein n=1 Tax=Mytilus edulis TaxID=6550 RepID=A0A8S3Q6A4_MYTED|nr:unnamed protein product [Mytilus edulis]
MLLSCFSLIFFTLLEGTAVLKGENQVHLKDWFIDEPIFPIAHGSLAACTSHCVIMDESMSMFYNGAAKKCICINTGYIKRPSAIGQSGAGWNYYLILDERCPRKSGYVYSKIFHSCYKLHMQNNSLLYIDYNPICEGEGGELMKIDSDKKQQHVADFLDQFEISTWFFFQGSHIAVDELWYYNDGSIMSYFNWAPTQPDMSNYKDGARENIAMRTQERYAWFDLWPKYKGNFLCERRILEY